MLRPSTAGIVARSLLLGVALATVLAERHTRAQVVSRPHVTAELVSELDAIAPGTTWLVALRLVTEPEWHSYWRNAGDSGSPPSLDWTLPAGFRAGEILWPVPRRVPEPPLAVYGYEGEALFLTEIEAPRDLTPGRTVSLAVHADWVVCRVECIAGDADLTRRVSVAAGANTPDPRWSEPLRAAHSKLPRPMPAFRASAFPTATGYRLSVAPAAGWDRPLDGVLFFPAANGVLDHAAPQPLARSGAAFTLTLTRSEYASSPASRLTGLLVSPAGWDSSGAVTGFEVDVPVEAAAARVPVGSLAFWLTLVLALAGGLLLNLMPCVFPVISLKVLGFASLAAQGRRRAWHHGLVFAAGVLAAFLALGGLLLALRGAGGGLGWGFQLQSPAFIAALACLMFGLALNLLGVFEVGTSLTRLGAAEAPVPRLASSFGAGVLATVVATPCTAPFMGVALGFALTQPPAYALLVFAMLGLGMASPYALLAASPRLLALLPRPGAWMIVFRQAVAFPLFATVAWLIWVLAQQTDADGVLRALLGLTLLSVAAWTLGRWDRLAASRRARLTSRTAAAAIAMAALALAIPGARTPAGAAAEAAEAAEAFWEPYSAQRLAELRREGRPVFVDFTAAWCLTCKVNERLALGTRVVRDRLRQLGVTTLKADWTTRDPEIERALAAFGRNSVPLYVLYHRNASATPAVLPTLLTPSIVLEALDGLR